MIFVLIQAANSDCIVEVCSLNLLVDAQSMNFKRIVYITFCERLKAFWNELKSLAYLHCNNQTSKSKVFKILEESYEKMEIEKNGSLK